jgi:uncharacterized protein YjeT (DUF2065 family)
MSGALLAPFLLVLVIGLARFMIASLKRAKDATGELAARQRRLRTIGVFVLLAGLVAAVLIYTNAPPPEDDLLNAVALGNSKATEYELERIGGLGNVYSAEFTHWLESLWHGRRLAFTVATLSLGGWLVCFVLAHPLVVNSPPIKRNDGPSG